MKSSKKLFAMAMAAVLGVSALAGCGSSTTNTTPTPSASNGASPSASAAPTAEAPYGTLVMGADEFNGVFSPFFGTTAYDMEISDLIQTVLLTNDRSGAPISNAAIYKVPEEITAADGTKQTVYTFELVDGLTFSDGTPATADDIIFSYLVRLDPNYDGPSTLYTTPIVGVNEYRYDDADYAAKIEAMQAEANAYQPTDEEITATANSLGEAYGEDPAGFLKDGDYYEDYTLPTILDNKYKELESAYIQANLSGGIDVTEVAGIKKLDEKTVQVTINGVDPKAIWNLGGVEVVSKAYYGQGYTKGDLSGVRAKNGAPLGAGPYKYVSYENNVVTVEANTTYFKGSPSIEKIKYQVVDKADKLQGVADGLFDISDPSASPAMVKKVEAVSNVEYRLIDNLGYGYIGINSERITDLNVRKGLMHLMNRDPAVTSYYGELATVIERPMSMVSWAYPTDANRVYDFSPEKALEYFKAAGYQQVTEGGKTVLKKDGKQLSVQVAIGGQGKMDHPSAPILTEMKLQLEKLGGFLDIQDVDTSILFDTLDAGGWDMWVAAWSATIDPDMYQTYHSQGPSNHYKIKNAELDQLIIEARQTNDVEVRKQKYFRALDIMMEQAVEMPVYQRKNMYIFNKDNLDISTLPEDMTPFYNYYKEIESLKMVK